MISYYKWFHVLIEYRHGGNLTPQEWTIRKGEVDVNGESFAVRGKLRKQYNNFALVIDQ